MSIDEAIEKASAKLQCWKNDVSGDTGICDNNCQDCKLCYLQGNSGEQIDYLEMAIDALKFQKEYRDKIDAAYCKGYDQAEQNEYDKVQKCIERIEELRGNIPVNRVTDNIIKDYPKELGQLMAYKKSLEIIKEEMGCNE